MKFVIPNPTYPAVDTPLGYSTLADSISVIHNKSFGVVPDKEIYRDFIEDTIGVNITYISKITRNSQCKVNCEKYSQYFL